VVSAAAFMLMLDITVVNVALPGIRRGLGGSFSDLQWVLDAYALTLAIFLLTAGSLADTFGRKRIFIGGFAAFTAASLGAGLAHSALELNLARAGQGVGGAVLYAVGPALIGQEYRGRQRGFAFAVFGAISGLAVATGPLIGGAITTELSWRWIFLVNVPVGIAATALAWRRLRDSRDPASRGADWPGVAALSAGLGLLVFALIRAGTIGWASPLTLVMLAIAGTGLAGFVLIERQRGPRAMLDLSLVRNRSFNGVSAMAFFGSAASIPAIFFEVSYVQNIRGLSPVATGVEFLPLTLTLFAGAAVAGFLTARVAPRLLLGGSLLLNASGIALFASAAQQGSRGALLASMILSGAGMGISNTVRSATAIAVAEPSRAGMTAGVNETFQQVGVTVGIAALGAFFAGRVAQLLAAAGHARAAGTPAGPLARAVAVGNLRSGHTPPALAEAGRLAFLSGLHDVLLAAAAVALAGAVISLIAIRTRDLDHSALADPAVALGEQTAAPASPAAGGHRYHAGQQPLLALSSAQAGLVVHLQPASEA
jgi:EmrB/QacA subfamily drug resistance transporter